MPNHYTTIAICSPGDDFDCNDFNDRHGETNLCEIVSPIPKELAGIIAGYPPARFRNKNTGEYWTVDCNGPMSDREMWDRVPLSPEEIQEVVTATGAASWYDWCISNWGTKWGTYRTKAFRLGGDAHPVLVTFESAWNPPSILDKIARWLKEECGFEAVTFVGFDPADDSVKELKDLQTPTIDANGIASDVPM